MPIDVNDQESCSTELDQHMFSPIDNKNQIFVEDDDYDMTMIHKRGQANLKLSPFDELEYQFEDEDLSQVGLREVQEPLEATQVHN